LGQLAGLIDWTPIENNLAGVHAAARGEPAWPPVTLFKALLIAV
jgi:IS5 family transposase